MLKSPSQIENAARVKCEPTSSSQDSTAGRRRGGDYGSSGEDEAEILEVKEIKLIFRDQTGVKLSFKVKMNHCLERSLRTFAA